MKLTYVQGDKADAHGHRVTFTQWFGTRAEAEAFSKANPPFRYDHGQTEPHVVQTVNMPGLKANVVEFMNHFAGA